MARFEDYFSQQASQYAQHRPHYPEELFAYLAALSPSRHLAWDCGTGNGQAAIALVKHFNRVVATDASPEQIEHAFRHERIDYWVGRAEAISMSAASTALVIVATAVHWFDLEPFYREVRRVLIPEGILAVWSYHLPVISPDIDRVLAQYYGEVLSGYWPERFRYVDERYATLPFPFAEANVAETKSPQFEMTAEWELQHLLGFIASWSATRKFEQTQGYHPIQRIWQALTDAWGAPEQKRIIRWPLHTRIGRLT